MKTAGNRIVYCYPVKDFAVRDFVFSDQQITFISDDYTEIASPWRPTYTVKITCVDTNFRQLWQTASLPNKGYFFYGERLRLENGQLIAGIGVQHEGSSTMCIDNFNVRLDTSGKIGHSVYSGGYNCGGSNVSGAVNLAQLFR